MEGGSGERTGVHQYTMRKQLDDTGPWLKAAADLEGALPGADWMQRSSADPLPTALVHSCAVVGSGAALRGGGLGARIDGHHLIARLNNAPSRGWEQHVGQAGYEFFI